ncbi:hypothetical protein [Pedobacter nutrimenti]|uniref:hypothetical protein n=1 Tax=Pedobacter nutrimenti TaxID=1241337 RepID=UPI002930A74D|nr:hypothetical protein [Pedobacter nutrimenti]
MNKNSNVLIALLIGLSAGTALGLLIKFNRRPNLQPDIRPDSSNKAFEMANNSIHNRFRSENAEDFEDHVEHI